MKRRRKGKVLFTCKRTRFGSTDAAEEADRQISYDTPNINSLFEEGIYYEDDQFLPYELLVKIFNYVIGTSDNPLKDLCNLAKVSENWRYTICTTPTLWSRIDLTQMPLTDRNIAKLDELFQRQSQKFRHVKEVALRGVLNCKLARTPIFIEELITRPPYLETLTVKEIDRVASGGVSLPSIIHRSIRSCRTLKSLNLVDSKSLFNNQKWISDHLMAFGSEIQHINFSMSLTSISSQLFRAIGSDFCPNLKFLDISTCDSINTHSFDAVQLSRSMPNLEALHVGNVSFKRVYQPPEVFGLRKLSELSLPIGYRDADRDDALFATLAYGSDRVTALDLRGSSITANALLDMPSFHVRELHIDDLCPITRQHYHKIIEKWAKTLKVLSLVKINCSETLKRCLKASYECADKPGLTELDLTGSDVTAKELREFLLVTKSLKNINLTSCRSLPRSCKGKYSREPQDRTTQGINELIRKLKS